MPLIATTVFHNGKIEAQIVYCSEEYYKSYTMFGGPDIINESTVSVIFTKEYLKKKGIDVGEVLDKISKDAPAGMVGTWIYTQTVIIPDLKPVLEEAGVDFHQFIDDYAEHLKTL